MLLPSDILFSIALQSEMKDLPVFFQTCSTFNAVGKKDYFWYQRILLDFPYPQWIIDSVDMKSWNGYRDLYGAFLLVTRNHDSPYRRRSNVKKAAQDNNLELVKILTRGSIGYIIKAAATAIKCGHLDLVKWTYPYFANPYTVYSRAARRGQLKILQWLISTYSFHSDRDAIKSIAEKYNQTHVVKWIESLP